MNEWPLVSVVCLCHNQGAYVEEAIASVTNQRYPSVELIVVDDGSADNSKTIITKLSAKYAFHFINIQKSIGNCAAFNQGFKKSKGDYIIDLAADDILMANRISKGMDSFKAGDYGVTFCNVLNIDKAGNELGLHFEANKLQSVPQGDVYLNLIQKYFISPPSMMIKREVLEELNGYDETLSYEDFDFWIRSSRNWQYAYTDDVLVKKRKLPDSLSTRQFAFRSKHQLSTLRVCEKIKVLNRSRSEDVALRKRCFYEIRQCIRQANFQLIPAFLRLI